MKKAKKCVVVFELNFVLCLNLIKYILETKISLEWSNYSFEINFHFLKMLKINLEVKILKKQSNLLVLYGV